MFSFRLGRRLVTIQAASYILPVYQKMTDEGFASEDKDGDGSNGSNTSVVTHRLIIPVLKVQVVKAASEFDLTPEMFTENQG